MEEVSEETKIERKNPRITTAVCNGQKGLRLQPEVVEEWLDTLSHDTYGKVWLPKKEVVFGVEAANQVLEGLAMMGNSFRQDWSFWSKLLGGEKLAAKKAALAALLEKPTSGKRFVDLLTSCVLQTHGVQLAKKKDEAPQETTDFVAMSFTDSEAGTPMKKKGTQQTGEASRGAAAWGAANERKYGAGNQDATQAWERFARHIQKLADTAALSSETAQEPMGVSTPRLGGP
eukprot:s3744_g2.t1